MIFIVPIEPIDQRYTKQWYYNIPKDLEQRGLKYRIIGDDNSDAGTTTGAFLNFAFTNKYKAQQVQQIADLFSMGQVAPGDKFLVTDAWNFAITAIRYMSELLNIPVEIHGIWHAGSYDPTDILGMKMGTWSFDQECAWYEACDVNYYATNFHKDMFLRNLNIGTGYKAVRSGQPHQQIISELQHYQDSEKLDVVMWPHRYNEDKQPEIAEDLDNHFNMLITQKMSLNKKEYYEAMGSSKVIFSCALHENLGISVMEGCLTGAIPVVPDRCSYAEMYLPEFKYPSVWTNSYEEYIQHKQQLLDFIHDKIVNYEQYQNVLEKQRNILITQYLNADIMYDYLIARNHA